MADKFLVVRLGSFGDVLLTTGVLTHWNQKMGCRFHIVTRAAFSDIFAFHPAVDKVIPVKEQDLTVKGWWDFCHYLQSIYPSMGLIDLHGNIRTMFLKSIWKGKVSGYPKMGITRRVYSRTRLKSLQSRLLAKNVPQRYAAALSSITQDQSILRPRLYLSSAEILGAKKKLASLDLSDSIVCLHPYATHQAKAWPAEKWKDLMALLEKKGRDWIVIGQNSHPISPSNSRDLTNQTSIRETGAIISICSVLITGDSGPMHLAAAVDTRVIGLFGPTSREWGFYPSGPEDRIIESHLLCRPCSLHGRFIGKCQAKCMNSLEPDEVMRVLP